MTFYITGVLSRNFRLKSQRNPENPNWEKVTYKSLSYKSVMFSSIQRKTDQVTNKWCNAHLSLGVDIANSWCVPVYFWTWIFGIHERQPKRPLKSGQPRVCISMWPPPSPTLSENGGLCHSLAACSFYWRHYKVVSVYLCLVLSDTNYHIVGCYMQVRAHKTTHGTSDFQTERCQVICDVIPRSESR